VRCVQLHAEEAQDEFSAHFQRAVTPKVLITTCRHPSKIMYRFIAELLTVIPAAHFYKRGTYHIKQASPHPL
jgi:ribosome production factor 1